MLLADYERQALTLLPPDIAAYFFGGAGDERTLRANRDDLSAWRILGRLTAARADEPGSTRIRLLDRVLAHPIIAAPVAYQRMAHPDAEIACAMGVTAQDGLMVLSAQSSQPMDEVRAAGPGCAWFQIYWQDGRDATLELARRAADAGYEALMLTLDAPVNGVRDREIRTGFRLPAGIEAVNLPAPPPRLPLQPGESLVFDRLMRHAPDWRDVAWLCENAPLPVIAKGILSPPEAGRALRAGVRGIVVSNHGGRVLDGVPSAIRMLPQVAQEVAGRVPVVMDGGIRRGTDVLVALTLGAQAVMIGRPLVAGLAVDGAMGVAQVIRVLRDEFEVAMALTGCQRLDDITPDVLLAP